MNPSRMRLFWKRWGYWAILLGLGCGQWGAVMADDTASRPNIVLIVADDLGIFDLGCYGRGEHRTPHLDRLAGSGVRYASAYCAQPICSASRAALMTGKFPARLHLTNYLPGRPDADSQALLQPSIEPSLPASERTIAELLREAGYATGLFGKWHLGSGERGPSAQGFDVAFEPSESGGLNDRHGSKNEFAITDAAIQFIESNRDHPYFCYVPHHSPHIPLTATAEAIERHQSAWNPLYAAAIESLDTAVGRLMDAIDRSPMAPNTIVIFASDNGGLHVPEGHREPATHAGPYRAGKGFLYEGGIRIPLIVRWPARIREPRVAEQPVVLTDLPVTLLEVARIDRAKTVGPLDGISIASQWTSDTSTAEPQEERTLYWHFPHYTNQGSRPAGAVLQGKWKLVQDYEQDIVELYDLQNDPGESTNLVVSEPEIAKKLALQLHEWKKSVGAQECQPNPDFNKMLHQSLYIDRDPSRLRADRSAVAIGESWAVWRTAMNSAVAQRKPHLKPSEGRIELTAATATPHGKNLRYEPEPYKNVLGYWTEVEDWADWTFQVPEGGSYQVEVHVGCGVGTPGSRASVTIDDQILEWDVIRTGHFQNIIVQPLGQVELKKGANTLVVRPIVKAGVAVMDIRAIHLWPVASDRTK